MSRIDAVVRYYVLIPFYRGDEYRERSMSLVVRHTWEASEGQCRIVVSEQNSDSKALIKKLRADGIPVDVVNRIYSGRFNKSRAWNDGIAHITQERKDLPVLLLDSDIIVNADLLNPDTIDARMKQYKVWHPFNTIADLDRLDSYILDHESLGSIGSRLATHTDRSRRGTRCYGGALFMMLSTYYEVGGYDVRYDAWGHEDDAFYYACRVKFGSMLCRREDSTIYHIWHPIQNTQGYIKGDKYRQLASLKMDSIRAMKKDITAYCKRMRFSNALFGLKLN